MRNRNTGRSTWYYIDEMHLLLKDPQTASYMVGNWKHFRKWGGIPNGMTQNAKDLLASREIENIFENSDFVCISASLTVTVQSLHRNWGFRIASWNTSKMFRPAKASCSLATK